MIDGLICLVATIISGLIFEILFYALNNSMLMLFVPIQNSIARVKNKKTLKYILYLIFLCLAVQIKGIFNLNYLYFGICLGFFYSFSDMLVGESIVKK
ncbi:hypothetical protein [Clostridium sp.]|uniref:hypothetical protein n=1 Tax=Clostridium sp. TaxID=1506 RepID=UPI00290FF29B|nr:hypothetical protein [Clostridium sp.]MDU5108619.1 hypothetical protein [Clostridium sp.]